jgi:hypothetical protein
MNVIDNIEKHNYVATEAQVEALAREHHSSAAALNRSNLTYLRIIIAGCQAELGGKRGRAPAPEAQMSVLEKVHGKFYAAVLRGVVTEDVAADDTLDRTERGRRQLERNSRSGFARSSATTVRNFIRAGLDIRGIDVMTVTKSQLQKLSKPETPSADKITQRILNAEEALLRAVRNQARGDPNVAAASLEAIMERLQQALDELLPDKPMVANTARDPTRTRVGVPVMRLPQSARTRSTQP